MLLENINNAEYLASLNPKLVKMYEWIQSHDPRSLEVGRYEIDGEKMFCMIQEYDTKPINKDRFEAHRRYIDFQLCLSGVEHIAYSNTARLKVCEPYKSDGDIAFYTGEVGTMLRLEAGDFAIFYPHDAHMPCVHVDAPGRVRKLVVKIRVY